MAEAQPNKGQPCLHTDLPSARQVGVRDSGHSGWVEVTMQPQDRQQVWGASGTALCPPAHRTAVAQAPLCTTCGWSVGPRRQRKPSHQLAIERRGWKGGLLVGREEPRLSAGGPAGLGLKGLPSAVPLQVFLGGGGRGREADPRHWPSIQGADVVFAAG